MNARGLFLATTTVLAALATAAGCGSSSSGTLADDAGTGTGGNDGGSSTDGAAVALANLDAVCDDGPTGREILAQVHEACAGTYTPPKLRPANAQWTGSKTPSAITLTARYAGGAILCSPRRAYNCPPGAPCAAPQGPTLSVDVEMTFATADGTFAEAFVARATRLGGAQNVLWEAELPATKIAGTYPIAAGAVDAVHLVFQGQFYDDKNVGSVSELTSSLSMQGGSWSAVASAADAGGDAKAD